MKEIHFYTNLCNEEQTSEWDLDTMCTDYVSTENAILNDDVVKTTQISFLSNAWNYIEKGVKVFIHNDSSVFEIKEGIHTSNGKYIRTGHNIERLLIAGCFGEIK